MVNGAAIYAGRSPAALYGGRSIAPLFSTPTVNSTLNWTRQGNSLCIPRPQCCCKGPFNIAPGEQLSLPINWAAWLQNPDPSQPPLYNMNKVASADFFDMLASPPAPANPDIIKVVSGIAVDDPPLFDNADVSDLILLRPPYFTEVFIEASDDAVVGSQYRLRMCLIARDCEGHVQRMCDCFVVTVAEC